MNKQELRKLIAQQKAAHTLEQRKKLSAEVCRRVLASPWWTAAQTVLLYHALADEVDTTLLIEAGHKAGKQILLPVVIGDELELRPYNGPETMRKGAFGIMEPTGTPIPPSQYKHIQLAIIPGMAFDKASHRLGRGKGYYDRLLPQLPQAHTIGICWHFQLLEEIPAEAHDVKMDEVISQ